MTDTTQPPTTPLPEAVEEAIVKLCWYCLPYDARDKPTYHDAANELRQAIATALTEARDDTALRERAERLRLVVKQMPIDREELGLHPGDLADDII